MNAIIMVTYSTNRDVYSTVKSHLTMRERRHAQSETLYNPEQMVTVFKQLVMLLNNLTIFFYTVADGELCFVIHSSHCNSPEALARSAFKWKC